jgi:hypothetical protein
MKIQNNWGFRTCGFRNSERLNSDLRIWEFGTNFTAVLTLDCRLRTQYSGLSTQDLGLRT